MTAGVEAAAIVVVLDLLERECFHYCRPLNALLSGLRIELITQLGFHMLRCQMTYSKMITNMCSLLKIHTQAMLRDHCYIETRTLQHAGDLNYQKLKAGCIPSSGLHISEEQTLSSYTATHLNFYARVRSVIVILIYRYCLLAYPYD